MYYLDVTKEHCPMTFVKVKLALSHMAPGDILDCLLRGSEPVENVPKAAQEQGHRIVGIREEGDHFHIVIEKLV
jgi:TusA-related sulfurtransferase